MLKKTNKIDCNKCEMLIALISLNILAINNRLSIRLIRFVKRLDKKRLDILDRWLAY